MQIHLETHLLHSVQSYTDSHITVNHIVYQHSLILSRNTLINNWSMQTDDPLDQTHIQPLLHLKPELILIGHAIPQYRLPEPMLMSTLSKQRIGIECMPLGAACRTFNLLLSEGRAVVLGVILDSP